MGSLSQGIWEKAMQKGRQEGWQKGWQEGWQKGWRDVEVNTILKLHKKGYSVEEIADMLDKSAEEITQIIEGKDEEPA